MQSIVDDQNSIYGGEGLGPPLLPHGDDPRAIRPRKRRKQRSIDPLTSLQLTPIPTDHYPASHLPAGFPPELAYRALAAYSLIRTLSVSLRLSPFTPNVFLRALLLPYPSRLLGSVHVALLRILLSSLHMGYQWGSKASSLTTAKKRKVDGLRYPLRGGDNLEILDRYTWPIFYDDYCHLTADIVYAAIHDTTRHVDLRWLDVSGIVTEAEKQQAAKAKLTGRGARRAMQKNQEKAVTYQNELADDDDEDEEVEVEVDAGAQSESDEEFEVAEEPEDDDDEEYEQSMEEQVSRKRRRSSSSRGRGRRAGRGRARRSPRTTSPASRSPQSDGVSRQSLEAMAAGLMRQNMTYQPPRSNLAGCLPPTNCFVGIQGLGLNGAMMGAYSTLLLQGHQYTPYLNATASAHASASAAKSVEGNRTTSSVDKNSTEHLAGEKLSCLSTVDTSKVPDGKERSVEPPVSASDITSDPLEESFVNGTPMELAPSHVSSGRKDDAAPSSVESSKEEPFTRSGSEAEGLVFPAAGATGATADAPVLAKGEPANFLDSSVVNAEVSCPAHSVPSHESEGRSASNEGPPRTFDMIPDQVPNISKHSDMVTTPLSALHQEVRGLQVEPTALPKAPSDMNGEANSVLPSISSIQAVNVDRISPQGALDGVDNDLPQTKPSVRDSQPSTVATPDPVRPKALDPVTIIRNTIRGGGGEVADGKQDPGDSPRRRRLHDEADGEPFEPSHWRHFEPLRRMRYGEPYHRLAVSDKVTILEYLLDEILSIDTFAEEMNLREARTGTFAVPFGKLPSSTELENLVNDDECGVCLQEGDLLCCDGCPRSYHRICLDMLEYVELPEGRWLCPECDLVDPAHFGPLRSGRKSVLDWFSESDIRMADQIESYGSDTGDVSKIDNAQDCESSAMGEGQPSGIDASKFLVVHGYLFRRGTSESLRDPSGRLSAKIPLPLSTGEVSQEVDKLGSLRQCWPFCQIPFSATYFNGTNRFDPSLYDNRYRSAPVLLPGLKKSKALSDSDFEQRCGQASTQLLSGALSWNMTGDQALSAVLKSGVKFFDPLRMAKSFLLDTESELSKACLLGELWGMKNKGCRTMVWAKNVARCRSVRRLGGLLVQLVDAAHPRAFQETWFQPAKTKLQNLSAVTEVLNEVEDSAQVDDGVMSDLRKEALRRHWERSSIADVWALLAQESLDLDDWIKEVRPDLSSPRKRRSKRKRVKGDRVRPVKPQVTGKLAAMAAQRQLAAAAAAAAAVAEKNGDKQTVPGISDGTVTGSPAVGGAAPAEEETPRRTDMDESVVSKLRRRTRTDARGHGGSHAELSEAERLIFEQKEKRLSELVDDAKIPAPREIHWPAAGRMLFDPSGYLPVSAVKRLARKGGSVVAPFTTYTQNYEVGQTAVYHVWRKRVLCCRSYEEALMYMRVLETFLDADAIRKSVAITQRPSKFKGRIPQIVCTQKDLKTGVDYCLVFEKGIGRWESSLAIDLYPLNREQHRRRAARIEAFERHRKSIEDENRQKQVQAMAEARKAMEESAKDRFQTPRTSTGTHGTFHGATSAPGHTHPAPPPALQPTPSNQEAVLESIRRVLDKHKVVVRQLLAQRYPAEISEPELWAERSKALASVKNFMSPLGLRCQDEVVLNELDAVEKKMLRQFREEKQREQFSQLSYGQSGVSPSGGFYSQSNAGPASPPFQQPNGLSPSFHQDQVAPTQLPQSYHQNHGQPVERIHHVSTPPAGYPSSLPQPSQARMDLQSRTTLSAAQFNHTPRSSLQHSVFQQQSNGHASYQQPTQTPSLQHIDYDAMQARVQRSSPTTSSGIQHQGQQLRPSPNQHLIHPSSATASRVAFGQGGQMLQASGGQMTSTLYHQQQPVNQQFQPRNAPPQQSPLQVQGVYQTHAAQRTENLNDLMRAYGIGGLQGNSTVAATANVQALLQQQQIQPQQQHGVQGSSLANVNAQLQALYQIQQAQASQQRQQPPHPNQQQFQPPRQW